MWGYKRKFSSQRELFVSEVQPICCVSDKVTIQCKTSPELSLSLPQY
jgi:hypothetical protein